MAEFSEVCKQWRRMCDSFGDKACQSYRPCAEQCHVGASPVCGELREATPEDIERFEAAVMAWAKEHPVVYPTWGEYLISKGLLMPYWNERGTAPYDMYIYAERALANPIPADTAQKLGIEPKEA